MNNPKSLYSTPKVEFTSIVLPVAFALAAAGCDTNQDALNALRVQVEQSQQKAADLQRQISTLRDRIAHLESQPTPPKDEPTKHLPAPADGGNSAIKKAISACVQTVHSLETPAEAASIGRPYAEFDAFFNQGSGRVENNNRYVDQGPTYAFNKCMASKGVPLTY